MTIVVSDDHLKCAFHCRDNVHRTYAMPCNSQNASRLANDFKKNATAGQHALIQIHRPSSLFAPKPDWTAARGPHQAGQMVVRLFRRMR